MEAPTINTRLNANRRTEVFCPVRRRWVALTPEEEVRQRLLLLLHHSYAYPYEVMQVEGTISVANLSRRCDIVLHSTDGSPLMIVECKRPDVPLTQKVCDQACRYNTALHVPYLLLDNGRTRVVVEVDFLHMRLQQLPDIPHWKTT